MISPGKTIGVLGGGQLGRMFTHAAQALGYKVAVYDPSGNGPAAAAADRVVQAPYEDIAALTAFAKAVDVITYEFENVPFEPLTAIAGIVALHPKAEVLMTCQNRQREKAWLRTNGIAHARYAEALDGDIVAAVAVVGRPCVIKTADFGYDGKGQMKVVDDADLEKAKAIFRGRRCVVEKWIDFQKEISVVVARGENGEIRTFPVSENIHTHHILDFSIVPARVSEAVAKEAEAIARRIVEKLGVVGLIAVEFFVTTSGEVLVNEIAPRTHNSGHWSIDSAPTSQFEQQVRAVCGLPLGATEPYGPTVMVNILGDAWRWQGDQAVGEPNWAVILAEPHAHLHLYGKDEPRPGRKMGHFKVRAGTVEEALVLAERLKNQL